MEDEYDSILYWDLTTPDGTLMRSQYRHDYRTYIDANGKEYMVDGGRAYMRCSANGDEDIFCIMESDIPRIKELMKNEKDT